MMLLTAMLSALIAFGALQASTSTQPAVPIQGGAVLTGRVLDPSGQPMRNLCRVNRCCSRPEAM
jgi:hypothetical protein